MNDSRIAFACGDGRFDIVANELCRDGSISIFGHGCQSKFVYRIFIVNMSHEQTGFKTALVSLNQNQSHILTANAHNFD